jgi:hypothetical protein
MRRMKTMMMTKKRRTPNLKLKHSNLKINSEVFLGRDLLSPIKSSQMTKNLIRIVREISSNPRQLHPHQLLLKPSLLVHLVKLNKIQREIRKMNQKMKTTKRSQMIHLRKNLKEKLYHPRNQH